VNDADPLAGDPPQVPPTVAVYPLLGVTVKVVVAPWLTLRDDGLIVPFVPADADAVHVCRFAVQFAVLPPFNPLQLQVHGPLPPTALSVPAAQRLLVGFTVKVCPLDVPHAPFTGTDCVVLLTSLE